MLLNTYSVREEVSVLMGKDSTILGTRMIFYSTATDCEKLDICSKSWKMLGISRFRGKFREDKMRTNLVLNKLLSVDISEIQILQNYTYHWHEVRILNEVYVQQWASGDYDDDRNAY